MINRFKAFKNSLQEIATRGTASYAKETVEENQDLKQLAIKMNKDQILAGYDSKGNPTGSYTERTKANRTRRGLQIAHKDYNYTGKFFAGFYVSVVPILNSIFKIDSTDSKRNKIIRGSDKTPAAGKHLFGLSEENLAIFRSKFKGKFIKKLRDAIKYR